MAVEAIEQLGSSDDIDVRMSRRFLQRLARSGLCGQVDNDVGGVPGQHVVPGRSLGHVRHDEFGPGIEFGGPLPVAWICGCRLSTTTTRSKASASGAEMAQPMKPAPPVTSTVPPGRAEVSGEVTADLS